jgi:two-component system, OmpR family, phosphate regulon sensor histidine kinase PhoR
MKRSLFVKLFMGFFFVTFILTAYILLFSFRTIERYFTRVVTDELRHFAASLQLTVGPLLERKEYSELDAIAKRIGKDTGRRITVIDPNGTVLADSMADPATMENHSDRPEVQQALWGKEGVFTRFSGTLREEMLYVGVGLPRADDGKPAAVLRVSVLLKDMRALMRSIKIRIFVLSAVIVAFSLTGAWLFSASLLGPIRQLTAAAARAASGDFEGRVFLKGGGELKLLADTYNHMTDKIRRNVAELSDRSEELETIMSAMQPGLLVFDDSGKIGICNRSAEALLRERELAGRYYWEVIDSPELFALIKEVRDTAALASRTPGADTTSHAETEAGMNGSWYRISAAHIGPLNETVLILSDITELKNLERIKRDFVMNVSHELRTPLTAIKGYAETIEGIGGENEKHLEVIKRHTDRLINIVQDLLTLSELEEREAYQPFERIRLDGIATQTLRLFEDTALRKGLTLSLRVEGDPPEVEGDTFRLEQLFINLIDNAVKYTDKGGVTVTLKLGETSPAGREAVVTVQDTGIGISEQHFPRIFERFYTVDKSHSRKLGGTGLGLAIVKHIVLLHGGSVDVESIPGEGTTFTVRLPSAAPSPKPPRA